MYRKTYALIDCKALENNIKEIKKEYSEYDYYFGVVKANAYGHGIECVKYMLDAGINYLAVATLEEALKIRTFEKKTPILVLEPINYDGIKDAIKNNVTITIDNVDYFKRLVKDKIKCKFHLKIDTGMNRFGLKNKVDVKYIFDNSNMDVYLEGLFTQFYSGVGESFKKEMDKFYEITSLIDLNKIPIIHLDRSLTMEQHKKIECANGVRLGIVLYGYAKKAYPLSWKRKLFYKLTGRKYVPDNSKLKVKSIFNFYTNVIEIKDVEKGENIGYGGMYDTNENVRIGILPYGFADFLFIKPSEVYINGKCYKTITNYMDITTVLIDDNVKVGDKVEIFGENISIRDAARRSGQNVYKLICSVSNRVPRVYKYDTEEKEVNY